MSRITLGCAAALFFTLCLAGTAFGGSSVSVRTATVREHKLSRTVTAYGKLVPDPHTLQWLTSGQGGRISAVPVTAGSRVRAGQTIVRIEPTPQTRAKFQSARSTLASARAKLKQVETLEKNGLATKSDLESARSALASAKAQLAALKAEGVSSKPYAMKAPGAGIVTQLSVTRGQWVSSGGKVAALAPAGALWVNLGLEPREAARVRKGAAVRLTPVFASGKPLTSRVARVAAQADAATGLVNAEVPVSATARGPIPGDWVKAAVTLQVMRVPAVPRSAVLTDKRGAYVFVVRHGVAHRVAVKALIRANGLVGVSGVKPGEVVVRLGNFELHDGEAVREAGQ